MNGDDYGASVNDWVNVVRRARLGRTTKFIALLLASRADADGTRIFPGVARLAVEAECDYRTARRALDRLRKAGLIEVARRGARRSGKSDEYRLILVPDLLERCDVPTPAAEQLVIQKLAEQQHRAPSSTGHQRPVKRPVDNRDYRSPVPGETGSTGQGNPVLQGTGDPPPSLDPYLEDQPPSDETSVGETRTGSAPAGGADDSGFSGVGRPAPRSAVETEAERQRQAGALNEWIRQHPEAVAS